MINKKILLLIFPLLIIVIISGCINRNDIKQDSDQKNIQNYEINCYNLEGEIKQKIKELNYCDLDDDCILEARYGCPFGCFQFFNKEADLSDIDEKIALFRESECNLCDYMCTMPPESHQIKCVENKCIDIRYNN